MREPGLTTDACAECNWPEDEHNTVTGACPDYRSNNSLTGWLSTRYRRRRLVLTESVMTHMLADIGQIVTEWEQYSAQRTTEEWFAMLRAAVNGEDYKR